MSVACITQVKRDWAAALGVCDCSGGHPGPQACGHSAEGSASEMAGLSGGCQLEAGWT